MTAHSEIFYGPMKAGKSLRLLEIATENRFKNILAFKPRRDQRDGAWIKSRGSVVEFPAHWVDTGHELITHVMKRAAECQVDIVLIDEIHLFQEPTVMHVSYSPAGKSIAVYAAGLDQDYQGRPFRIAPELDMGKVIAAYGTQTPVFAVCDVCGSEASRTQRLINGEPADANAPLILVGGDDVYQARCKNCHEIKEAACA